jgi:predicted RNA polymerase sigma factor
VLLQGGANPIVKLNHAAAVGMAPGPAPGLALLDSLGSDPYLAKDYRLYSVRAHLFEMTGETPRAHAAYLSAAARAPNLAQQRYLYAQAARLSS